ncbi:hypothetical protein ABT56_14390 [Photobacterium aquae]|uniref:Uncharacterized protein n=1 Tax=Photobacterium aquae TaxID=1195763 RepID=A0A0J1GYH9_9GAMM|nr:hypothetical protein [Photobacterium aquae]KLV04678.1 hypothetical protein ABT56_14390 [Photobacterium aquae]
MAKTVIGIIIFLVLAVTTQIGAISFLLALVMCRFLPFKGVAVQLTLNVALYTLLTFAIVPHVAPYFGREPIAITSQLKPTNYWLTYGLNRQYVTPELNSVLAEISTEFQQRHPTAVVNFLDAGFPFIKHYPLLPHLSHHDGRKVDLSFFYLTADGKATPHKPSRSGYGIFENPHNNEKDTTAFCKAHGYFQYDYPKYLTLGVPYPNLKFDEVLNRNLISVIVSHPNIGKVFIEPHLRTRLGLSHPRIRFHGCGAVRHDDHIHLQL